jgi:N-acetylglucosaminylphosphatidylinositol deacetylase
MAWMYLMVVNVIILYLLKKRRGEVTPEVIEENKKKNVLFLTAHPDDEAMFFTPTIKGLHDLGYKLYILCLSTGNGDGLGKVREKELEVAAKGLGFTGWKTIDDEKLQDGKNKEWKTEDIIRHLEKEFEEREYKGLITFDNKGVSGHSNHIALAYASEVFAKNPKYSGVKVFQLQSVNLLRKFIGLLDMIISSTHPLCFFCASPIHAWRGMIAHKSQLVWFRRLYLSFSRYVHINTLNQLPSITKAD